MRRAGFEIAFLLFTFAFFRGCLMRKVWNYRRTRPLAGLMAVLCLLLWQTPPAAAFQKPSRPKQKKTQTPDAEQRQEIEANRKAAQREPDVRELSAAEMQAVRGRGAYRNAAFNGVLPWQKSFRDVNLCNGNLFKSFTDIQVSPARGAGLALQRTYNSNDERVGPFGVGWTHAYDTRIEEAGGNDVPRTDFFGGKHNYTRDADGLYSPPPYLFDELSSNYDGFLADGPPEVLSDDQKGMDGTVKHFISGGTDADGSPSGERVLDSITDRHGNQTVFTYGLTLNLGGLVTKNLLTRVTDPSGRYLDLTWSNLGTSMAPVYRITQVQGPFDASNDPIYTVTYEYNGDFNLWKVHQDPSGLNRTTTFTYTTVSGESGLLASVTDGLGHTVSYNYSLTDANGFHSFGTGTLWATSVTEPGSGGTNTWNLILSNTAAWPDPLILAFYCATARLAVGATVDDHLRCTSLLNGPLFRFYQQYKYSYDTSNNVTSSTARPLLVTQPTRETVCTYGPHGNVLTQSTTGFSGSATTTSYYDASKYFQKESVTDANGNTSTFDYYDNADVDPGNRGEVKWVRDARYGTTGQQFEYTYNSYGQKQSETNLNDVVTEYTYGDAWGNLTEVVQDPGMGHLNRTTSMSYDAAGRVVSSTDPKSQNSTFAYNGVGQPTTATLPDETVSYDYGANGRTESVTDDRGTTTLAYESGNDRVASVTDPVTGAMSYTYLPSGARETVTLPGGGTWAYDYVAQDPNWDESTLSQADPNSITPMLASITDDNGRIVEYSFDLLGTLLRARTNQTYSSGQLVSYQQTDYAFDRDGSGDYSHGWLKQIQNTWHTRNPMTFSWSSAVLVQNDYTYDDNGNRLTNTVSDSSGPIRTEEYGYDALNRLTGVDYGDGTTQGYAFDPMGNRLSKTENSTTESYSYNNANMLLTRGGSSYTNDANGNTLTGGGRTNTWDGENRLTQCVTGTDTSSFVYGADGLRRQTTVNSVTTDFVLDGQSVVRERQGSSNIATYLHGARGPEYRRNDSTGVVQWYLYDGLGCVLGELDSSGNITAGWKYDVYGGVRASTGTGTSNHKFVGSLGHPSDDSSGFVYMRARHYDPVTGRFASEDPISHGSNWYIYAANNPLRYVDRNGEEPDEHSIRVVQEAIFAILIEKGISARAAHLIVRRMETGTLIQLGRILLADDAEARRRGWARAGCAATIGGAAAAAGLLYYVFTHNANLEAAAEAMENAIE